MKATSDKLESTSNLTENPSQESFFIASSPLLASASVLSTLGLTACGGEESSAIDSPRAMSSDSTDDDVVSDSDSPISESAAAALPLPTPGRAARFLQQAQFSSTYNDTKMVSYMGYSAWLDKQFAMKESTGAWDYLVARGYNNEERYRHGDQIVWHKLMTDPNEVRQRIALALSEWFVISLDPFLGRAMIAGAWWDLLSKHAFGNFRALLEDVTLSGVMGQYLNMAGNLKSDPGTGRQPDENYAREIMQLFTIGLYELNLDGSPKLDAKGQPIETYDANTVANLAKVFTGWKLDRTGYDRYTNPASFRNPMVLKESDHETSAAIFLGVTVPAGTSGKEALRIALDTLFNHPNVGPFFGKFLIQRLVCSNPHPRHITRVARAFHNNGKGVRGDMKAVIRAVLLDPQALNLGKRKNPTWGKVREPMVRMVQWARTFDARSATEQLSIGNMSRQDGLGQSPLRSPSVFNFFRPGYVPPNTNIAKEKLLAPEFQISDQNTVAGYINVMCWTVSNRLRPLESTYANEIGKAKNASALVEWLNLYLTANSLSTESIGIIVKAVEAIPLDKPEGAMTRVQTAVLLVMASPDYIVQK